VDYEKSTNPRTGREHGSSLTSVGATILMDPGVSNTINQSLVESNINPVNDILINASCL